MAIYIHYEDAAPEFTLKVVVSGAPMTVSDALARFAAAYGATGHSLSLEKLQLVDDSGKKLGAAEDALLPCGVKAGSDVFVKCSAAPVALSADAAAAAAVAAKAAVIAAGQGTGSSAPAVASVPGTTAPVPSTAPAKGVYAAPGSAIAASQAKMGENSYYYSVGRNRAAAPGTARVTPAVEKPAEGALVNPIRVAERAASLPEQTIASYAFLDDEDVCKVHINMAGAALLPDGAISCVFREQSFDLRVTQDGKVHRLHIPILGEQIKEDEASIKKKTSKLIVVLPKREAKGWYELRKTKGVGDTEFSKIVPDSGDEVKFTL